MKFSSLLFLMHIIGIAGFCQHKSSEGMYIVPDSIKAIGFYAEVKINTNALRKGSSTGIYVNGMSLVLGHTKGKKQFSFGYFAKPLHYIVYGKDTDSTGLNITWKYNWEENETYPLPIATANDSATHKTLYSGYVYLPDERKWKLIGTDSHHDTVRLKYLRIRTRRNSEAVFTNRWLLRSNGSWKALDSQASKPPVLRHMSNIDSLYQQKLEEDILRSKLPKDSIRYEDGVFYQSLKEGSGRLVKVTDTLTVHYKGSLYSDGSVFDQTKEKPATFPLERLI